MQFPVQTGTPTFHAVVGMAAMLGASLRTPVTALIALLELIANLANLTLSGE